MIQKIKSWLEKERLDGHQPNEDPEGPPPKSGGADPHTAPTSIDPDDIQDPTRKDQEISFDTEEIDLEGKPSQVLVLKANTRKPEVIDMLQNRLKHLANEANLSKEERKQVMYVNGGDVEFQTLDLGDSNE